MRNLEKYRCQPPTIKTTWLVENLGMKKFVFKRERERERESYKDDCWGIIAKPVKPYLDPAAALNEFNSFPCIWKTPKEPTDGLTYKQIEPELIFTT